VKQASIRLWLSFFGFALIGANSGALGVLLPSMGSYYHVDQATIGFLFLASSLGYFFSALGSSILLARLGLRIFLTAGALLFLLGALSFGILLPFAVIVIMKVVMGYGIAMLETGFNAYCVALPRHTPLLNSLHAFYGAGAFVGPFLAAWLLAIHWGWNSVYLVWAVLCLPLMLVALLVFSPLPPRSEAQEGQKPAAQNVFRATLTIRLVWIISLFLLFYVGVEVSLGNWAYTFLTEGARLPIFFSSSIVSGYWLGLTLGRFTLAQLAERFGLSSVHLVYICIAGALLALLLILLLPVDIAIAVGFCFVGLCLGPIYPTTVAVLPKLVPGRLVSTAIGFLVSLSIIGLALFPGLAGILAQDIGIASLLPYMLLLSLVMLLFWWLTFRRQAPVAKDDVKNDVVIEAW
jgi:fucose permease